MPGDYQYTLYKIEKIINEGSNAVQFDFIPGQIHLSYDYAGKKHLNSYHSSIDNDEPYSLIRQYLIDPITPIVINAGEVKNFSSKTQPSPYFMICYPAPAFPDSVNEASVSTREIASRYTYKTFYTQEKDRYITVFPRYGNQLVPYYRHINKEQLIKIMNEN